MEAMGSESVEREVGNGSGSPRCVRDDGCAAPQQSMPVLEASDTSGLPRKRGQVQNRTTQRASRDLGRLSGRGTQSLTRRPLGLMFSLCSALNDRKSASGIRTDLKKCVLLSQKKFHTYQCVMMDSCVLLCTR